MRVMLGCSTIPLPFFRSVTVAVAGENGNAGCWKRLSVYIGMKRPERRLVARLYGRTAKIGFDPCYGTAVTAQRQVGTATAQQNFFT